MVLIKRRPVDMVPPPDPAMHDADAEAFYLAETGEVFLDYESYAARMSFYRQRRFQCEVSGRQNLTFFEAHTSELLEAEATQKKFPASLKGPVLKAVQFVVTGRLDNLVDKAYDRFKDRFFVQETVMVERFGERYWARIVSVYPPRELQRKAFEEAAAAKRAARAERVERNNVKKSKNGTNGASKERPGLHSFDSTSDLSDLSDEEGELSEEAKSAILAKAAHQIGADLNKDAQEAYELDDPSRYLYHVRFLDDKDAFVGSLTEVQPKQLLRDRLTFSKTILKKYMKDCLLRDATVGAPWTVRPSLAERFGIPTEMSEELLRMNAEIKEGKLSKRKKVFTVEEEEANANKKPRKIKGDPSLTAAEAAAAKEREEEEKRLLEKKKIVKYPVEDLLIEPVSVRELNSKGKEDLLPRRRDRPIPSRELPVPRDTFEILMNTYYFLQACGKPLMLSPFSLDDYEAALRHSTNEPSCTLMAEVHASLINIVVRDGTHSKDLAPANLASKAAASAAARAASRDDDDESMADSEESDQLDSTANTPAPEEEEEDEDEADAEADALLLAARDIGRGWDKRVLKLDEDRDGWEASLIGILAKRASLETMPRLTGILSHLTGIAHPDGHIDGKFIADTYASPEARYGVLPLSDKLLAIQALCELAVMTKPIKHFYEECEAHLTELRKERVEIGRARKKLAEDRAAFEAANVKEGDEEEGEEAAEAEEDGSDAEANGNGDADEAAGDSDSEKDELESSSEMGTPPGSPPSNSSLSDVEDSRGGRSSRKTANAKARARRAALPSRQEALRERALQREQEEKERRAELQAAREASKQKAAESRQVNLERKRLDDEEARLNKRDEAIDRDFRRHALAPRLTPLGRDRFFDRYWWFDGIGSASLLTPNGAVSYSTGRLFVQGARRDDWEIALAENERGPKYLEQRRKDEQQAEGVLQPDEWAVYSEAEQVDELLAWLRAKGNRELALRTQLLKFHAYIGPGMAKRAHDLAGGWRDNIVETRRSNRSKGEQSAVMRLPYMAWRNTAASK